MLSPNSAPMTSTKLLPPASGLPLLGELAAKTVTEAENAVVRPDAPGAGPAPAPKGPTDRWGRPFDPALHQIRPDGTPKTRGGRTLILLDRGKAPIGAAEKRPADRIPEGTDFLDLGAEEGAGADGAAAGDVAGSSQQAKQPTQPLPQVTEAAARLDGQALTDGLELLGVAVDPDEGRMKDREREALETRWKNVFERYNLSLPIGQLFLALTETGKYSMRVATTPKARDRMRAAWAWMLGRPKPRPSAPDGPANKTSTAQPEADAPPKGRQIPEDMGI